MTDDKEQPSAPGRTGPDPGKAGHDPAGPPPPPRSPRPPRGPRLRVILLFLAVGLIALAAGVVWSVSIRGVYDRLYANLSGSHPAATRPAGTQPTEPRYYTCGMHPWVVLPAAGDCPICRMKLVPIDPAKFTGEIVINPIITQNIGVRISPVTSGPVALSVRTVGAVDYDETRIRDITTKVSGWIEKLYVDHVGKPVEKGQPLFELYSPELYAAQEEYLVALRSKGKVSGEFIPAPDLLDSARKRLEYLDISPEQIKALEASGKPAKTMTLRAPFAGLVTVKNAFEGMKIDAGAQLFRIADLTEVWVMVALYEYQLPYVQTGQEAVMTLPYLPGEAFKGKVIYIYPYVNPESRQVKMRLEFANPAGLLKPGMFAGVELRGTLARERVLVPREAVVDTGERQVAFVSLGAGRFQPRQVRLGVEAEGGMVEILDGLKPGEMVVTSGQFLLDSESRLREALAKMIQGTLAAGQQVPSAPAGATELKSLPEAAAKEVAAVLDGYFQIGTKLSQDSTDGLDAPGRAVAAGIDALIRIDMPGDEHFWRRHAEAAAIRGKALELIGRKDLAAARETFADLSIALGKLIRATGVPPAYGKAVEELHCPMYREGQGGNIWLQAAGEVRNPFFSIGRNMRGCYDRRVTLPVTGAGWPTSAPAPRPAPPRQSAPPPVGHQH